MQLLVTNSPGSYPSSGSNPPPGSYPPGPGFPPPGRGGNPALRASDADRDQVLTQLSAHYQAGRLTTDEFDERSSQALQARTMGDLAGLLTDLPAAPGSGPGPAATAGAGQAPARRRDFGVALAGGVLGVLAVVAVIAFLSRSGHGADGGWGFIVPALIVWRVLAGRHQHRDDHHQHRHDRWQHDDDR
jgi:hypothetical protein